MLTLGGQRNHRNQLLSHSGSERLTFVQLSLQGHPWQTHNTAVPDSLTQTGKERHSYLFESAPHPCLLPLCWFWFAVARNVENQIGFVVLLISFSRDSPQSTWFLPLAHFCTWSRRASQLWFLSVGGARDHWVFVVLFIASCYSKC